MRSLWRRLQTAPRRLRWPIKWAIFALVVFLVLYPHPVLLVRHIQHLRHIDELPDPHAPALAPVAAQFDDFLATYSQPAGDKTHLLTAVNDFVRQRIPHAWDWDVWGVVDYLPTLAEVIAVGREDCDGQAVLAAALLRAKGIDARLIGDMRHVWVYTPVGETMTPLGEPAFTSDTEGLHVRWGRFLDLGPVAVGTARFPFRREAIILLCVWVLLLPLGIRWPRAALALFLLFEGLVIVRLAGSNVVRPDHAAARWGFLHLLLVVALLRRTRTRWSQHTGRSVL